MFIITSFKLVLNTTDGFFAVYSDEPEGSACCPLCGAVLTYRDSRLRGVRDLIGIKTFYLLRRLRCCPCRKLHTEIPDFLQPYKHYDSHAIQCVIDGNEEASECVADNSTIRRWKNSFKEAEPDIAQRMASLYTQETDELVPFGAPSKTLAGIRAVLDCWLAFVMRLLINNGHKICTRFAFCPPSTACRISSTGRIPTEGGGKVDQTIKDTS